MIVKGIQDEDFVNYKKPSMFIAFPSCTWKCEKECGKKVCQNGTLATSKNIEITYEDIVRRYMNNNLTSAIVMGGLEAFDSFYDLFNLIYTFREETHDDIVIYTGYYKEEIEEKIEKLKGFSNIVVKYGRFIPDNTKYYNELLGVELASSNQYVERINYFNES